ncbi:hypothetical protein [Krasilnikovia cinnamomea]|uniref:hypothetical protein n=1 Tax=Krasilnikovia cinnamomea TaxID=349313 RepID=UPI00102CE72E|nr:hypothetical protein [Krasilnikovia cinnamomea]
MSVASIVTAATVVAIGYRLGRAHAAWRDVGSAKRDVPAKRRIAWGQTRGLLLAGLVVVAILLATAYEATH